MKSFLIISAVFPPETVVSARLSFDLAMALHKKQDIIVISPKPTRPLGFKFNDKCPEFDFKHIRMNSYTCPQLNLFGRIKESYSFGRHCYKYISENNKEISLIYANTWALLSQYYTVKAAKKYSIPIIIHIQDIYPESLTNKIKVASSILFLLTFPIDKYIMRNATRIVAISDKMKKHITRTRKIDSEKIFVVPNWQDEESFIQFKANNIAINENKSPFTFMFLGNIGPVAGVDLLINAYKKANIRNTRLVIAGSGSMKETLIKAIKRNNDCSIEFWDVPDGMVPQIQSMADVMLLPIKKGAALSSIPSKLPAYMFSEKPIIACIDEDSDTGDVLRKANCGWIIPAEDIDLLSETMSKVVHFPKAKLQNLGQNGYKFAINYLSRKNNLSKMISIITGELND